VDEILTELTRRAHIPVERFRDPELLRDNEVLEIRGSHDRLTEATGWQPAVPLARSLDDTLAYWRLSLGSAVSP
jgi:nucleoside-diphosphate-sugar epimerase